MTRDLFFTRLHPFDSYITATKNRKAILLIDNCSAHGNVFKIPELCNVSVEFLPPKTISKMQPLDAELIAAMKLRYRSFQMERALDLSDENVKSIYKVEILSAMQTVKMKWKYLEAEKISNCWQHTKLEGENTLENVTC